MTGKNKNSPYRLAESQNKRKLLVLNDIEAGAAGTWDSRCVRAFTCGILRTKLRKKTISFFIEK
jgi:hypothetical protein